MAFTGMAMGIYMGTAQDFTLAPAHAHLILLGWVTMAIYGLYYRSLDRPAGRLPLFQVVAGGLGAPAMAGGLGLLLMSPAGSELHTRGEASIIVGSTLSILSMLLFVVVVARNLVRSARRKSTRTDWGLPDVDPVSG
jgi:hypothetical protein